MQYTEDDLRDQLAEAEDLPFGPVRTSTVEQIVAHADAAALEEFGLEARIELINAYHQGNEPAKEFSVFGWCLAYWDRNTDSIGSFEAEMLRWQYKWVVSSLTRFPSISLDKTDAALNDMQDRYLRGGHSLHAVHSRRHSVAKHVGDQPEAAEQFRLWQAAARDENSDCEGCDPELKVEWLMDEGRDEDAMELANSVLSGQLTCREQPASMLEIVMLAMARLGRIDDARSAHLRSYRSQRGDRDYLQQIGAHLRFLALTGNEARGLEVLERHIEWIDTPRDPMSLMLFAAGAARLLARVSELGQSTMTVHRPSFGDRAASDPTVVQLQATMTALAVDLAGQFDQRNKSPQQSKRLQRLLDEAPTHAVPLDAPSRRVVGAPPSVVVPGAAAIGSSDGRSALELAVAAEAAEAQFDSRTAAALRTALIAGAADDAPDPATHGLIQDALGWMALYEADPPRAQAALREAIGAYGAVGDRARAAMAQSRLALSLAEDSGEHAGTEVSGTAGIRALAQWAVAELSAAGGHPLLMASQRYADVLTRTGAPDEALSVLAAATDLADVRASGILRMSEAFACLTAGRVEDAIAIAGQARTDLLAAGHSQEAARAGILLAQCLAAAGHAEAAAQVAVECGPALRPAPTPHQRARVQQVLGSLLRAGERIPEATAAYREAVADFTAAGLPADAAGAGYCLAECYLVLDRSLEAAELLEQYLPVYEEHGTPVSVARTQLLLGQALASIGETESAGVHLGAAADTFMDSALWDLAADAAMMAGNHCERAWQPDEAADRFSQAVEAFTEWGEPVLAARAARRQAKMAMLSGADDGRELFATALAMVQSLPVQDGIDLGWELADWNDDMSWSLWNADLNEEAMQYSATAETGYAASGDAASAGRTALFASQLAAEREDWASARSHVARALTTFRDAGLEEWAEQAQAKLDGLPGPS